MSQQKLNDSSDTAVDVVSAVARATNTDPLSLEPRLCDVVDPDALERVVESEAVSAVTFDYDGHTVVVDGDGTVTVDETPSGDPRRDR